MTNTRLCELCSGEAKLYCESDSAYLCSSCDANVHEANFLVARHIRRTICSKCKQYDGNIISGIQFYPILKSYTCSSCSLDSPHNHDIIDVDSSSSSSDCVSAAESYNQNKNKKKDKKRNTRKIDLNRKLASPKVTCSSSVTDISNGDVSSIPASFSGEDSSFPINLNGEELVRREDRKKSLTRVDLKVEGILVNWCKKLGLKNYCKIVPLALHALRVCLENLKFLPFKVAIACSFWLALKFSSGKSVATCQNLKRLEEVSGVPVKMIVCAEGKISRVVNLNRRSQCDDRKEGCDEC
ncbi:hypothetical protein MKW94_014446 [Papaver nudicaule]|uniref:B box-type domain-containing protein n=1 Tax=Papaver nudicaule TaxID=74823 RepID=A0AA41VH44_PAPNU|nr:hypothetical protein [Papaver nudicaule]